MEVVIKIPVPIYLKKFLEEEFGADYRLSTKDVIGKVLFPLTESKKEYIKRPLKCDEYFIVVIPNRYLKEFKKATISVESAEDFAVFAESLFRNFMRVWVLSRVEIKREINKQELASSLFAIQKAIKDFLHKYRINEDDFKLESAKKFYDRWYLKQEKTKKTNVSE